MKKKRTSLYFPRGSMAKILLRMKLLTIFMLCVFAVSAAESYSQSTKFNFDLNDVTVRQVFQTIEENSEFILLYNEKSVDVSRKVSVKVDDESVESVLNQVFKGTENEYRIYDRQIVILEDENAPIPSILKSKTIDSELLQQKKDISGSVKDKDGASLPGVSVVVKGTTVGTVTNADGEFTLSIPVDSETLQFSFVGMKTQDVAIAGKSTFAIVMEEETVGVDEVVVTALGIEKSKRSLTYVTQKVDMDNLATITKGDVGAALAGKVAGVAVMTGSTGGSRIIIRGERSINGSNTPLVIMDGVPSNEGFGDVDNIESINVLKGASASALYGAAAANGVVIITTKKGKKGTPRIEVNSQTLFGIPYLYPDIQNVYGQGDAGAYSPNAALSSWGPKMTGQTVTSWTGEDVKLLPQEDNIKDLFRTSYSLNNSFSYSTGNDKATAYFSYKNSKNQGLIPVNSSTSHKVNMRIDTELIKNLKLDAVLTWVHSNNKNVPEAGDDLFSPMWQLVKMPRSIRTQDIEDAYYYDSSGSKKQLTWAPNVTSNINPYWAMEGREAGTTSNRVNAVATLRYDFNEWLYVQARGRMAFNNGDEEYKYYWDTQYVCSGLGKYELGFSKSQALNADILLGLNKDLTKDLHLSVNLGAEIKDNQGSSIYSQTGDAGLVIENKFYLGNGSSVSTTNSASHTQIQSVYGTAQLSFRNYLFLDVTARNDWSSTLPSPYSYFYPSAGLTGVISDMIDLPEAISYFKLRGSYAEVGNGAGFAQIFQTYSRSLTGTQGYVRPSTTKVASQLIPENTKSWEAGTEIRVAKDKFGIDFTWYKSNTYNQLVQVTSAPSSGYSAAYINCGNIQNKGLEIMLNAVPVQTSSLKWDIGVNFSRNWSKVIELTESLEEYELSSPNLSMGNNWILKDRPYGEILSRGFVRNDEGRIVVDDLGMPKVTSADVDNAIDIGNFNYDFRSGLNSNLQYKNWNLYFLIDLNYGGVRQSATEAQMLLSGTSKATLYGRDGFVFDGVQEVTDSEGNVTGYVENDIEIDAETYGKSMGGRASSGCGEVFTHKATNSRLRELSIGYKIPLRSSLIKDLTVSAVGRNLFYIYNACGWFDPDVSYNLDRNGQGSESAFLPGTRSIGLNIKLTL